MESLDTISCKPNCVLPCDLNKTHTVILLTLMKHFELYFMCICQLPSRYRISSYFQLVRVEKWHCLRAEWYKGRLHIRMLKMYCSFKVCWNNHTTCVGQLERSTKGDPSKSDSPFSVYSILLILCFLGKTKGQSTEVPTCYGLWLILN